MLVKPTLVVTAFLAMPVVQTPVWAAQETPPDQSAGEAQPPASTQPAPERTLYVVATAHLDTQWLWTIQKTIDEYIPATLRQNFALFEKYPDYVFSFEGAFRYMLAKEYYPEDYAKLRQYIAAGRWQVCGSSVDACDVNIPSPQSLIRHVLYGNAFFKKEFGKTSCDIFLPDCFGFGYALPAVARHCGLRGFSTQKLTWGSSVGVPFDVGLWEGVDGSTVVAAIKPDDYVSKIRENLAEDATWLERIDKLGSKSGAYVGYKYFGVGDEGGAPDDESVSWLEKSIASKGPIRVISAAADRLYRDLVPSQVDKLPYYNGELLMTRHGTGCYTSQAAMKRFNRRNEQLADAAERASVAADWLGGAAYPREKLTAAWIRFLWHQFHDDITGTSIPQAYTFSWNDELIAANQFAAVLTDAAGAVCRALDTKTEGIPLVVYNPLSIDREDAVEAAVKFDATAPKAVRVFNSEGKEVPSQIAAVDGGEMRIVFLAAVPSVGFAVYDVRPADAPSETASDLKVSQSGLENSCYRVTVNEDGDVAGVLDKAVGKELLAGPARLQLLKDTPDKWPEWEVRYEDVSAEPAAHVGGPAGVRIVERGPARASLEITRQAEGSTFVQRIRLASGGAGGVVEFDTRVDWRTPGRLLKAAFRLAASNPKATYDLGLGVIERGNNTDKLYEVPAQQWADLTAADGKLGVAILNDCKYGWDKPADDLLRLTLIHNPPNIQKDIGWHAFKYAIAGHKGGWRDGRVPWLAARLNQPLAAFQVRPHAGPLGKRFSLLSVDKPEIVVSSVKKAESSDEVVIRLQELAGKPIGGVRVSTAAPILAAREVTGAEEPLDGKAVIEGGQLVVDMHPYRPRAFALKLGPAASKLAPPACKPVPLPFDADVISLDGNKADGAFDALGHSMAGELLPPVVVTEGITFEIGSAEPGKKNAVTCRGQDIELPGGKFNRLYLLAASAAGDTGGTFKVGDKSVDLSVQSFTGFVGQSQSLVVDGKVVDAARMAEPFVKTDAIAWVGNHRHAANGKNEAHVFTYLFKYAVDLPAGAAKLTLPDNDQIRVLALTLADNADDEIRAATPLYDRILPAKISPPGGLAIEPVMVTIRADAPDARIRYTLDGGNPAADSKLYEGPFKVDKTTTVRARVFQGVSEGDYVSCRTYTFVEPRMPDRPERTAKGLNYKYYEVKCRRVGELAEHKPVKSGVVEGFDLSPRGRDENFGFEFAGFIEIPRLGVYTFYTNSDDASALYIGDVLVVDNDGPHGKTEVSGQIALAPGRHAIRALYLQGVGDFALEVSHEGPGLAKQPIPTAVLCREVGSNEE